MARSSFFATYKAQLQLKAASLIANHTKSSFFYIQLFFSLVSGFTASLIIFSLLNIDAGSVNIYLKIFTFFAVFFIFSIMAFSGGRFDSSFVSKVISRLGCEPERQTQLSNDLERLRVKKEKQQLEASVEKEPFNNAPHKKSHYQHKI